MKARDLYQFKQFSDETLVNDLRIGQTYYQTTSWCGKPNEFIHCFTPLALENDNYGLYFKSINFTKYGERIENNYIKSLQNDPGKAVFDSREAAEYFHKRALAVFNSDSEYQNDHVVFKGRMNHFYD